MTFWGFVGEHTFFVGLMVFLVLQFAWKTVEDIFGIRKWKREQMDKKIADRRKGGN